MGVRQPISAFCCRRFSLDGPSEDNLMCRFVLIDLILEDQKKPCRHMRSGKSPKIKRLQASLSLELWCCCMEATERSLHVATRMGREPLTSKGDARQGVRVSQVVGSLQKTTQHGWKRWRTLKNVFDRSVPQPIWTISYMKWNHQRRMVSRLSNGVQGVLTSQKEA